MPVKVGDECYVAKQDARKSCLLVNAPLIHRANSRVPFSILKYAMTLDGENYVSNNSFLKLIFTLF